METQPLEPAVLNSKSRVQWTRLGSRLKRSHGFQTNRWRRWSGKSTSCSKKRASLPTMTRGLPRLRRPISNRAVVHTFGWVREFRLQVCTVKRVLRRGTGGFIPAHYVCTRNTGRRRQRHGERRDPQLHRGHHAA